MTWLNDRRVQIGGSLLAVILLLLIGRCSAGSQTAAIEQPSLVSVPAEVSLSEVIPTDEVSVAVTEEVALDEAAIQTQVQEYLGSYDSNEYCIVNGLIGVDCVKFLIARGSVDGAGGAGESANPPSATQDMALVVYNPQERPVYTIGEDPKGNSIRGRFQAIFEPIVPRELRVAPEQGAVTFPTDKVVLGDVLVNGIPVFRDTGKEAEITMLPANSTLECPWWCSVYEVTDLRPADALAREFIAGCTDRDGVGCQSVAWHWFEGGVQKDAYLASLEAIYTTPCSFWVGKRMPAGASCLVEFGRSATITGADPFLTVYDGLGTWSYATSGQREFMGQMYLYSPTEFSVTSYN